MPIAEPRTITTARSGRGRWPLRDYPSLLWLMLAVVVVIMHRQLVWAEWLLVHLVLLGALSHAVLVWSFYFSETLLRAPAPGDARRGQNMRIGALLVGTAAVLLGLPLSAWWLVVLGATAVAASISWHGYTLWRMLRAALPGRFRASLHYYLAAAAALVVGASLGAILARGPSGDWHGRLLLAHSMTNLLGWIGLTVTGTLVTFWPTLLRTRMDDRAERLARQALPMLLGGLAVVITGALIGRNELAVAGLLGYLFGLAWWGRALLRPLRAKPPREFASASVGSALPWGLVGIGWVGVLLLSAGSWAEFSARFSPVAIVFAIGLGAQLLLGALSYLIPAVLGGGPAAARAGLAKFNTATTLRLVLVNAGLLIFLLPAPTAIRYAAAAVGGLALASFLPIIFVAIRAQTAAARAAAEGAPEMVESGVQSATARPGATGKPASVWSGAQLVAALAALSMAISVGIGVDPAAAGFMPLAPTSPGGAASTQASGEVVRLSVSAQDMVFVPNNVTINAGDRLVIELVNDDPTNIHDLAIAGQATPRLAPGESAELDLGVVTESIQGWCTIAGHRQMGMVFDIIVAGQPGAGPQPGGPMGPGHHRGGGMPGGQEPGQQPTGPVTADPDAQLSSHVDPVLPPLGERRVHELTLTVEELPLEVAPGVWQQRWTYNGSPVGPTLHGRVGDRFEITLVNNGTMGHSIDFHAGELAPDEPMRTIPPGESLVYSFTANRSGIWMYHCSTAPMSAHIAAGMHGAVIIEPDGLPEVDRSYVLVQSEVYMLGAASDAAAASEVDAAKVATKNPDFVTFNGIANQYDQQPFEARVGERVRFWLLDAGPNLASSFHIVGGQFDTVYFEGGYQLNRGQDGFGNTGGGSQALGLLPAQGGFVELVFPEAGHYPLVSHIMSDAERGAHGIVRVTD